MSVNSLRRRCHAMLAPAFPWLPVLSICIFVGTCSFGVEWQNEIFLPPHQEVQEGKDKREPPLSVNERK